MDQSKNQGQSHAGSQQQGNSIFCQFGEEVYETDRNHFNEYLSRIAGTNSQEQVKFDPNTMGFVSKGRIHNLTQINQAQAKGLMERFATAGSGGSNQGNRS